MPCQECGSEKFEDTKLSRKSMERQHNGQKKKDKRTNNDLQNITQKTKDRVTRTLLKTGVNSGASDVYLCLRKMNIISNNNYIIQEL